MALMDLDGVASAESDVRASVAGKMRELTTLAGGAIGTRFVGDDVRTVIRPQIAREQCSTDSVFRANEKLQSFGRADRRNQIRGGVEDAGCVTGLDGTLWRSGKDTTQACSLAGNDVHGQRV